MPNRKTEKHKVLFKGRFIVTPNQMNSDVAYRLLDKCLLKAKSLIKTDLKIHETGFHIGRGSGLVNIRKMWFYYKDVSRYFVFDVDRTSLILFNKNKTKDFISYFKFLDYSSLTRVTDLIDNSKPSPPAQVTLKHSDTFNEEMSMNGFINKALSIDEDNISDNVDFFFSSIRDNDDPVESISIQEEVFRRTGSIFLKQSPKIDNFLNSNYYDLFNGIFDDLDTVSSASPNEKFSHMVNESMFLYSQAYLVPILELYGACESDDEEV